MQKFVHGILGECSRGLADSRNEGVGTHAMPDVTDTCCSAHGCAMDLGSYLVTDEEVDEVQWEFLEEAYYGDVFEDPMVASLTDAVLKLGC